jgi:hypothetical protein
MSDQPIACTLAPDQIRGRMSLIDTLAWNALLAQETIEGGIRARFGAKPGIEQRVRELAAAESQCCAFLRFHVHRDGQDVVLDITGSPEAQPAIREFFPALGA